MKRSVEVKIQRIENGFQVSNNKGKSWKFPCEGLISDDDSVRGCVASLAAAMITGTISSILKESNSPDISFTLEVKV